MTSSTHSKRPNYRGSGLLEVSAAWMTVDRQVCDRAIADSDTAPFGVRTLSRSQIEKPVRLRLGHVPICAVHPTCPIHRPRSFCAGVRRSAAADRWGERFCVCSSKCEGGAAVAGSARSALLIVHASPAACLCILMALAAANRSHGRAESAGASRAAGSRVASLYDVRRVGPEHADPITYCRRCRRCRSAGDATCLIVMAVGQAR